MNKTGCHVFKRASTQLVIFCLQFCTSSHSVWDFSPCWNLCLGIAAIRAVSYESSLYSPVWAFYKWNQPCVTGSNFFFLTLRLMCWTLEMCGMDQQLLTG